MYVVAPFQTSEEFTSRPRPANRLVVNISELRNKVLEENDRVRAAVISVKPEHYVLAIRGQSPASGAIQAEPSLISEYGRAQQA
jgi:hypothetical protein